MIPRVTVQRNALFAGTIVGLLLAAPVFAQQPPASAPPASAPPATAPPAATPALPPGSPLIGRPEGNAPPPSSRQSPRRRSQPRPTSCRPRSSSYRPASTSRSMPAASPMHAHCALATRAPSSSAHASATRSPPLSIRMARPSSRRSPPVSIVRMGWPITTARSTSPSCHRSPRSTMSRPISTIRRGRRLSTRICRRTRRMAGGSSASALTISSIFRLGSQATTCCMTKIMARFGESISTALAGKRSPLVFACLLASTGIR